MTLCNPVPSLDLIEQIVDVLAAYCHGELDLLRGQATRAGADNRMCRQYIVKRRGFVAIARQMGDAEVLRVAIGRGEQPENHLRDEEMATVCRRAA